MIIESHIGVLIQYHLVRIVASATIPHNNRARERKGQGRRSLTRGGWGWVSLLLKLELRTLMLLSYDLPLI